MIISSTLTNQLTFMTHKKLKEIMSRMCFVSISCVSFILLQSSNFVFHAYCIIVYS